MRSLRIEIRQDTGEDDGHTEKRSDRAWENMMVTQNRDQTGHG